MDDEDFDRYTWLTGSDERFTLALILDVGEVLARTGTRLAQARPWSS
jgi:hypothetical protein